METNYDQNAGMRQLCREIFGTENPGELRKIAGKAREYDRIMKKERPMNVRGAGRKRMFTDADVDYLIELYHQGKSISFLAEYFDISRPTVYKYLKSEKRFQDDPCMTMRMIFMYKERECTVLDVDFRHRKIYIRNKTNDILHRAFGVVASSTWQRMWWILQG